MLVVNKPAGLVVHPGHGNWTGTLVNALAWHLRDNPDYDVNDPRLGLVHRIDKDTSGLLVVAKTPDAKTHLGRQFFDKTTRREYRALVWGIPDPARGRIEGNIGRSLKDRLQMAVFPADSEQGKHAVTHYEIVETFAHVSLVKCVLETGRTHQIRVHMKHIGHPLFDRRTLRRRSGAPRHHGGELPSVCAQLFRHLSASGTARAHARVRAPAYRSGDVFRSSCSGRYDGLDRKMEGLRRIALNIAGS